MNDATEFGLSLEAMHDHLAARSLGPSKGIRELVANSRRIRNVNICAASFCTNGDLLSQWRGYSGEGHGYSIGLSTAHLKKVGELADFVLGPCIYDSVTQRAIIEEIGDQVSEHIGSGDLSDLLRVGAALEQMLITCGAFFKDGSFAEEDEWRLVSRPKFYDDEKFSFRPGRSMPTPYYELHIGPLDEAIDEVVVGPCPHMELAKSAATGLLFHHGVKSSDRFGLLDTVRGSKVPYRSW